MRLSAVFSCRFAFAGLLLLMLCPPRAEAQSFLQTDRSFLQSPAALGMGNAGVALPSPETVFFYNPAHLARALPEGNYATALGLRASGSTNLQQQYGFYRDRLQPAIDSGLDNLTDTDEDRLYDEAWVLGRRRALATGDVILPSGLFRIGRAAGMGIGLFAHSLVRYRLTDGGAGVPTLHGTGQVDLMAVLPVAFDLGFLGLERLSVGAAGKITRRYLTLKSKPLDAFNEDEDAYVLKATSRSLDLGLLYAMPDALPGHLTLGAAFFDWRSTPFIYTFSHNLTGRSADNELLIARELGLAQRRALSPSYRIGAAYAFRPDARRFKNAALAIDYVGYQDPRFKQTLWTHFRLGIRTQVGGPLHLRAGLSQGYPTVGAGLHFGFMRLNYAFYGVEEGRIPGQAPRWHHAAQIAIGAF